MASKNIPRRGARGTTKLPPNVIPFRPDGDPAPTALITQDELIELLSLRTSISQIRRDCQLNRIGTRAEKMSRSIKEKIRQQREVEDGLWKPRPAGNRLYIEI